MTRKAAEVFMAFDLERNYSKEEILELYVNTIYFGDGYYTVADASEGYFGKAPEEMTKYESTLLAGIPNAPSRYAPTKNPGETADAGVEAHGRLRLLLSGGSGNSSGADGGDQLNLINEIRSMKITKSPVLLQNKSI